MKDPQIQNGEVSRKNFEIILYPLHTQFKSGKLMLCVDSCIQHFHYVISAWIANYFENIHLHEIKKPRWPVCKARKYSCGEGNSMSWQLSDNCLCLQKMILATQGVVMEGWKAIQYREDRVVGTMEDIFRNYICISPITIIIPNILHTVYLRMLKYLLHWVTSFLDQHSGVHKCNQLWAMMPPYRGFA